MAQEAELIVGQTYVVSERFSIWHRRKVILAELPGDGSCVVRQVNGLSLRLLSGQLQGPMEPMRPGIDALCMLCQGRRKVPVSEQDPDRPWIMQVVGDKPCPHCGT